jgi:beta-hydroxylase
MSLVGNRTFFDVAEFPWIRGVEQSWRDVRAELDEVLTYQDLLPNFQDISTDQYQLTQDDRWKTFFLYGYGFEAVKNIRRCPATARVVQSIPGMTTAFFSILAPGKKIPPHGGPYKGVLRLHLALRVPEPASACGIRVREDVRTWEEGRCLVFDDTWEHEAWNDTDGTRVVLFVDFIRPLRPPAAWLNQLVIRLIGFSPFVQDAKIRHNAWERRFEQIRGTAA